MEFSREKQAGHLQNDSGQPLTRQPYFQIADNRPEAAWQAKMVGMIEEGNSNLSQMASGSTAGRTPLQRKPWPKAFLPAVAQEPMYLSEKVSDYEAKVYEKNIPDGVLPVDRSHAITEMAAEVATTKDIPEPKEFLTASTIRTIYGKGPYQSGVIPASNKGHINSYNEKVDPFYYKLSRKYAGGKKLNLYYQFAQASYGYIVKIKEDTGKAGDVDYQMDTKRGYQQFRQKQEDVALGAPSPLFAQYPSAHETVDAGKISELANKGFTDAEVGFANDVPVGGNAAQIVAAKNDRQAALDKRSLYLDAITKLGGEGARFQCVRNHMDQLKNDSVFYYESKGQYKGITFQKLWGMWGDTFKYAFNIDNPTVIAEAGASMQVYKAADLVAGCDFDLDNDKAKQ